MSAALSPRELVAFETMMRDDLPAARALCGTGSAEDLARAQRKLAGARARNHLARAETRAEIIEREAAKLVAPIHCGKQLEDCAPGCCRINTATYQCVRCGAFYVAPATRRKA